MSLYETTLAAMRETFRVINERDGARVTTACMYPSNGFVQVIVRGGENTFYVSDDGGAVREIEAAGGEVKKEDKLLRHLVDPQGLIVSDGVIHSPQISSDELALAISLVANTSRDAADWLFKHTKTTRPRNFRLMVERFLRSRYTQALEHNAVIIGESTKPHKFEHLIRLDNGSRLLFDPVILDPSSISARVVAHLDVKRAGYEDVEQRITYDDEETWSPEDLNLLQIGARVVPFSKAAEFLDRMAPTLLSRHHPSPL